MLNERGIPLRQALEMEILKDAKVVGGAAGLDRIVTEVSIMEVPDIQDWVKSGVFLITTAYSLKDDSDAFKNLVPALNSKELAGLAIKTKRFIGDIPDYVIQAANELDFPVIELPYDLAFSEVISTILREIFDKQTGILMKIEDIHQRLIHVLLSGGSLKEIGGSLHEIIGNPIVIKDYVFGKAILLGENKCDEGSLKVLREEEKPIGAFLEPQISFREPYIKKREFINGTAASVFRFPIVAGSRMLGEICVYELFNAFNAVEVRAVQYTCAIIALELMKQVAVFEVESRHRNEYLEQLLSSDPNVNLNAVKQAEIYGLEGGSGYIAALIYIEDIERFFNEITIENGSEYKNKLIKTMESIAKQNNCRVILGSRGNTITMLMAFKNLKDPRHTNEKGMQVLEKILQTVCKDHRDIEIFASSGRSCSDLRDVWKSHEEAKKALSYSKIFRNKKLIHYDELGIFRLLCMDHQEQEIKKFCQECIMPLVEYDRNKDGELVKTLQVYFDCGGNLKQVCKKMYIHYNTILYRIQKIQQITGVDLSDADSRLNLEISLKIMSVMKEIVD